MAASKTAVRLGCGVPLCNCGSPPCQCVDDRCYYSRSYGEACWGWCTAVNALDGRATHRAPAVLPVAHLQSLRTASMEWQSLLPIARCLLMRSPQPASLSSHSGDEQQRRVPDRGPLCLPRRQRASAAGFWMRGGRDRGDLPAASGWNLGHGQQQQCLPEPGAPAPQHRGWWDLAEPRCSLTWTKPACEQTR